MPIIMYDICKFYPIWLPPVKKDILTILGDGLSEFCERVNSTIKAFNEGLPTSKELSDIFDRAFENLR